MVVLSEHDLAALHDVMLQDSGTIVMLELPGEQQLPNIANAAVSALSVHQAAPARYDPCWQT
jgi:hypothetical protein